MTSVELTESAPLFRRSDKVLWRGLAAGVILLAPTSDEPVVISGSGAALWNALAEPISVDALLQALADRFDVASEHIRADVQASLDDLSSRDFLETA